MRASLITRITWLALAASLLMTLIIALFIGFFSEHARQHHRRPDWRAMQFIARQIYERPTAGRIERMTEEFGWICVTTTGKAILNTQRWRHAGF